MDSKSVKKMQPIDSDKDRRPLNEARLQELTNVLTEREKELNYVYTTSRLFENESLSIDDILQGVIDSVPAAWQYPEITCARIKIKNKQFITERFEETDWKQAQNIIVNGKRFGSIEVYYTEEKPTLSEGPFLKEERNLLYVIAERLGHTIERKMAESNVKFLYQRERELREKLQSEMRVRVDFTRKLIHELKTPLTSLIATSQLLYDETQAEKLGKLAKYILDSASNLNFRVDELQDVVRGETGILRLTLKPVDIQQLLQSLINETQALAKQSGISIELNMEREIPEIYADPDRLRQVVLNLVNNSIKYAREGHRIIIGATQLTGELQVEVRDFGPGIDEQRQKTIFEPGYQQSHLEERSGGLGIGLALCKTLIELHGGRIWVKSKVGKGARFIFSLPLKEVKKNDKAGH
jgi:signal transduction histidine kinase